MSETLIEVESPRPGVRVIALNRPDKRNALNMPLLEVFCDAMEAANDDDSVRVIILTGRGTVFCAGLDLAEARDPDLADRSGALVARALKAITESKKVTIAAVRGAAIAGGAGFMLGCDLAVVSSDFRTGFTEVRRGLVAGLVMTFLRRKVPEQMARELLLLGDLIGAERARELALVNRVTSPEGVMDEALALAAIALKGAPGAIAKTKALYDALYHVPVAEHIAYAQDHHKDMRRTEEAREGLAAFAEKRPPAWDPDAKT
jgi:methylglutaconyl-CoA hydratase